MSLHLDQRQRAMLAEIGVSVWWPHQSAPVPDPGPAAVAASAPQIAINKEATSAGAARAGGLNDANMPESGRAAMAAGAAALAAPGGSASTASAPGSTPMPDRHARPAARPAATAVAAATRPAMLLALPDGIADMDWPALTSAVANCQACRMGLGRQAPVLRAPPAGLRCDWLVLGEPPDDVQERAGQPFVDDAGKLLDNMLKAVGVQRCSRGHDSAGAASTPVGAPAPPPPTYAYLSLVLKCRPARPTSPDSAALAACANYLRREIALLQPRVILAMGRFAMQVLLSQDHPEGLKLPLGKLRGQVWHYQGVPVVVTYPPAYLLRTGSDKARAWADLCLALDVVQAAVAR